MAKNDIDYTLLEIIEGPKRINNITHEKLFDYLLEATESQDRFETFLQALEGNAWWAYLGFMLMSSDMIPVAELFKDEFKELQGVKYQRGSTSEHATFNMIMSYFERGILTEQKHRTYIIRYMGETLAEDEYEFCATCLKQKYKKEVFPFIKQMYENGKLNSRVHEFFSFAMNHSFDKEDRFTNSCLPVKNYKIYTKVGGVFFDGDKLLEKRNSTSLQEFVRVTSLPGRAKQYIEYPMVCEFYVEDGATEPFMIVTTKKGFLTRQPIPFDDIKFIELFYRGYENFVCALNGDVVSFISKKNGFVSTEEIKCKSIKKLRMPLLILGVGIDFLLCKLEDGNEITVFLPASLLNETFKSGDTLEIAKYSSTYYLRGKK
jgi:hypothetical protein